MTELLQTSEQLHATVVELRGLVGDLETDKLTRILDQVSQTSESTIDYTMRRLTLSALLLIAALVVGQLLYRLVATKFIKPAPR